MKKRLLLIVIAALECFSIASAQTNVNSGSSNIDVQVKRAVANGPDVYVDLLITSTGSWKRLEFHTRNDDERAYGCRFYDDEGKLYKSGESSSMQFEIDGERSYWYPKLSIENDVPRKLRIIVKNVDEYATEFTSVHIPYWGKESNRFEDMDVIIIKHLPITR